MLRFSVCTYRSKQKSGITFLVNIYNNCPSTERLSSRYFLVAHRKREVMELSSHLTIKGSVVPL